jgi:hypothetical protein
MLTSNLTLCASDRQGFLFLEDAMCGPDSFDWKDIALIGSLVEELAEEERERQRLQEQVQPEEDEDSDS